MKIVHLTDLHVQTAPRVRDLWGKRLLGSANLYLLGRKSKFDPVVQRAAVEAAVAETPDAVVITGDLTAQALDAEFAAAHELLGPILERTPTVIIAGNHDTYVRERVPAERMRQVFGPWMGRRMPWLHRFDEVAFLAVETCRAHPLSMGFTPPDQLREADRLLDEAGDRFVFLTIHYPLRGRDGGPYGPASRGLSNAREVETWLAGTHRIDAVLHGHEHHGFRTETESARGPIPIINPGSSGYARQPDRDRTAHYNVYDVDRKGLHGLRRMCWDGEAFVPEPGGAYATGR